VEVDGLFVVGFQLIVVEGVLGLGDGVQSVHGLIVVLVVVCCVGLFVVGALVVCQL
jgi:hypothetical protein